jgi:GAF domain-containing protein
MPFAQREVDLLKAVGNVIGVALENARLFQETERRNRELQSLYTVTSTVTQSLHIDTLMQTALETTINVLGVDAGRLYVFDGKINALRLAAHWGISEDQLLGIGHYAPGEGVIGKIFVENRPFVFADVETDPNYQAMARGQLAHRGGFRSVAGLPITVKDSPIGVIYVYGRLQRNFTQEEMGLFSTIGGQIGVALENARLFEESEKNLRRIRALREIDQAISSTLDFRNVLDVLMEKIDLVLPYSATTVRLFNQKSGLLEPVACRNLDEEEWKAEQWKGGRGTPNVVFETKAPWTVSNVQTDPRVRDTEFFRKHGLVSYLGVPLIVKDEILGVLSFYTKEEHEYTGEEVEFLSTLAGQAAIAIHNARLYEETERRRREAEELARVAQSLTETLDMTAVGERIVTSVRELVGVKVSTLRLLQPDGSLRALASSGEAFSRSPGGDAVSPGKGLTSRAVAEGRPIWSADMLNDPEISLTDEMRDYQLRSGNSSMIAVPLRAHEKIIGVLTLSDRTGRIYSESEVALVQTFADQAALALENARLYKEARTREVQLEETNRMLAALHEVAVAAVESLHLDRVLEIAIEKITEMFRFDATRIHIYDERTDEIVLKASFANDPDRFTVARSFRRGEGIVGKVAESGKALIFEDIATDPLYQKTSRTKISGQFGYHFFAVFPIRGKLKNLGTLGCVGAAPRKLSSGEIQLLEAIADRVAGAIENSELYEQLRQKVQELQQKTAELERANQVKDEFLSVMSHELRTPLNVVVGYASMITEGMLGEVNLEQKSALEKVIGQSQDLLNMITSILYATSIEAHEVRVAPQRFALGDLMDEIKAVCDAPRSKPVTLCWDYTADLPAVETDREKLKHILQNLIHNAVKFTESGRVTVSARIRGEGKRHPIASGQRGSVTHQQPENGQQDEYVELRVADTGVGIPKEKLPIIFEMFRQADSSETRPYGGVGLGLYIAKNFTKLLGGKIEVETQVGKGSTFTVTIPMASREGANGELAQEKRREFIDDALTASGLPPERG